MVISLTLVVIYIILGGITAAIESQSLEFHKQCNKNWKTKAIAISQTTLQIVKIMMMWWAYILEDILLYFYNKNIDPEYEIVFEEEDTDCDN